MKKVTPIYELRKNPLITKKAFLKDGDEDGSLVPIPKRSTSP
jgi:hypothetical protein